MCLFIQVHYYNTMGLNHGYPKTMGHLQKEGFRPNPEALLGKLLGRPEFTLLLPTKPLAHWPFQQQTMDRHEVSPEVILDGLDEELDFLNQVL